MQAVLDQEAGSESADLALALVRYVGLAAILLCVGGAAVLAFVVDPRKLRASWHWIALAVVGAVIAVDSLLWISLTGVKAAGFGLDKAFDWSLSGEVLDTSFGRVWLARAILGLALAALAIVALRRRSESEHRARRDRVRDRRDAGALGPCSDRGVARGRQRLAPRRCRRRLGRRPRVPCARARRSRRRPLVARPHRCSSVLDARSCVGGRARRIGDRERLPRDPLLVGALGDDLRAALAREGRDPRSTARARCVQQPGLGATPQGGVHPARPADGASRGL